MKMLVKSVLLLVCIVLGICTFQAQATPITFVFSADGVSGTLDSNPFSDASLVVTIHADTSDIAPSGGGVFDSDTNLTGTFSLSGIGSGSFDELLYVFNNQGAQAVGFGDDVHADLVDISAPGMGLGTYDMKSAFGPIVGFVDNAVLSQFFNVGTSLGSLTLASAGDGTFQAIAQSASVPEPGNALMFALGLLGLGFLLRRSAMRE